MSSNIRVFSIYFKCIMDSDCNNANVPTGNLQNGVCQTDAAKTDLGKCVACTQEQGNTQGKLQLSSKMRSFAYKQ